MTLNSISSGNSSTAGAAGDTPSNVGGAGGYLNTQKDSAEAQTAPKFGDMLNKIQAQYGAKVAKPREVKKTLGKDDFLKIMITQMQHQDPTNPFKAEQMATEMAQFTSVEQMSNINQNIQKLASQNTPMERLAMTGLIGKTVTVDRDRFPHKEGDSEALSYALPQNAASVKIALVSESGEVALEKDVGPQKAGEQTFAWDGTKGNTIPAKAGEYMLRIEAKDDRGQALQINSRTQSRVIGVIFEGQEPVLLVGDARNQEKVTMKNVVRIDGDVSGLAPGASAGAAPAAASDQKNFFTFTKGVGSQPVSSPPTAAPPATDVSDQAAARARDQARAAYSQGVAEAAKTAAKTAAQAHEAPPQARLGVTPKAPDPGGAASEKGFPNGLHD